MAQVYDSASARVRALAVLAGLAAAGLCPLEAGAAQQAAASVAWWTLPLALGAVSFLLGIVAVLAGVGGGVLFVPIVSALFPFHLDFVRGTGLLIALAGALASGPGLLTTGMASLRLALPFALVGSVFSVIGALLSFSIPAQVLQTMLGITILAVAMLIWRAGTSAAPAGASDRIAAALGLSGVYLDPAAGAVDWRVRRTLAGLAAFAAIGLVGGLFGLGAGWANVPALNLLLGVPLKGAIATSGIVMSVVNTSAAWIYIERGAVLPMITVPAIIGVMLGATIGARLLHRMPAALLRWMIIAILLLSGLRTLAQGSGLWG